MKKLQKLEIREIEITSPIQSLKIGDDYLFEGEYINGYEKGVSKIKRFYKETIFYDGVEKDRMCSIWMELQNGKMNLLGFFQHNKFSPSNKFKNK